MRKLILLFSLAAFIGLSGFDESTNCKTDLRVSKIEGITSNMRMQSNTAIFEVPEFVSLVDTQPIGVEGPFRNYLTDFCNYDANGTYYCCYNIGSGKPYSRPETPPGPR